MSKSLRVSSRITNFPIGALLLTALVLALTAPVAFSQEPNIYQMYYVPMPENEVTADNKLLFTSTGNEVRSILSIASALDGTVVYYDHNADGYEFDVTNPTQTTTRVWGDGDDSNGIAPGFTNDPTGLPGGTIILLDETYNTTSSETCATATDPCRLNGGDRFGSNKALAVTRAAWNTNPGSVLAGALEVATSSDWGNAYTVPIGGTAVTPADTPAGVSARQLFELTNAYVQARSAVTVTLTRDLDSSTEVVALAPGETTVFEDVLPGDTIVSNGDVIQLALLTGNKGVNYESRWYRIPPDSLWESDYYSPVGSTNTSDRTYYYLYNPGTAPLTVTVSTSLGADTTISVGAGAVLEYRDIPASATSTGVRFWHNNMSPEPFYVLAAIDAGPGSNTLTHDWGFSLIPASGLTGQSLVGFAPGSENRSTDTNASPVWVTAIEDTFLCLDYERDGIIDYRGAIGALEMQLFLDEGPGRDNDMTGAFIFSINDINGDNTDSCVAEGGDDTQTDIAVAWGQNPANAGTGFPAIDVGTTILAVPDYAVSKRSELRIDADGSGNISPGDTLAFIIEVDNYGALPLNNANLTDVLLPILNFDPANSTVEGPTAWNCPPPSMPGDPTTCTFGPFSVPALTSKSIEIAALLPADAAGVIVINNEVSLSPDVNPGTSGTSLTPVNNAVIGDTIWADLDQDGNIDAGEPLLQGVVVELQDGICVPGSDCPTQTTDINGNYSFTALSAGDFTVAITGGLPAGGSFGYDSNGGTDGLAPVTLTAGEVNDALDFGINFSGVISGIVFDDLNGNGVQDSGEPGQLGVTVELDNGSCTPGSDCPTTTTAADGSYSFTGLPAGNYQVVETDLSGYGSTTANTVAVVLPAGGSGSANFGDRLNGSISGEVYNDLNGDSIQNGAEAGLGGVTLELVSSACSAGVDCPTTTTAANGSYSFTGLAAGNYQVVETDLSGYGSTTANTVAVVLPAGGSGSANFGDRLNGSISGEVYNDLNGDSIQNGAEAGLGGVTLELVSSACSAGVDCPTTTTAANGSYSFTGLAAGNYQVVETDLSGYGSTTANTVAVVLPAGGSGSANFGDRLNGSISGEVYNDLNGDSIQNGAEAGLGGVTLELVSSACSAGVDCPTTTTAANGSYSFTGLAAGNYQVVETDLSGYGSTTANTVAVVLPAGGSGSANFGDRLNGSISGEVYNDLNGDSIQNGAEAGLGGVTLELVSSACSAGVDCPTTTTAANGSYSFTGLAAGNYQVVETDLSGYGSTTANTVAVVLPAGGSGSANFGDRLDGSISGEVYNDLNGDSIQNGAEAGLGGVTLELVSSACSAGVDCPTTTTAANGSYSFTGLAAGNYQVVETDLSGYGSTTANTVAVVLPAGGSGSANFGDRLNGSISGEVYNDLNGDSIQNGAEAGLGGVTLELVSSACSAGVDCPTTTTAANGSYSFTGLAAGNYQVVETDLSGYGSTTANTVAVVLPAGGSGSANFGDRLNGSISGEVYNDLNGDSIQNGAEAGLGGVTLELVSSACSAGVDCPTTTTAANGSYSFTGLAAGNYQVVETDLSGYGSTTANTVAVVLPAGGSGSANFGDRLDGSISGEVFNDLNGDSIQNGAEAGLGGVTLELVSSACTAGVDCPTTTTAADGSYSFTGLPAGDYQVIETDLAGYGSTTANTVLVALPVNGSGSANFGDRLDGSISGVVFNDLNGDTIQNGTEAGLGGVTVELVSSACSTGVDCPTTTTAADGSYSFTGLAAGDYQVVETDLSGYGSTTANTVLVSLPVNGSGSANFGDRLNGSISGVVFNDLNGDTIQNGTETGLGGVTVELVSSACTAGVDCPTTTTAADGSYSFTGLPAGDYQVVETDLSGYGSTTGNTVLVSLPVNGSVSANFGDQPPSGSINGIVFNDANANSVQDFGETPIAGVTIEILDLMGTTVDTATTAPDGTFSSTNLPTGDYTVVETDLAGYTSTTANTVSVTVPSSGSGSVSFGDRLTAQIAGIVFEDTDANGVEDSGEVGLGGVTIELLDSLDNVIASTTTAGDGSFSFDGLADGNYTLNEIDPAGYTSTTSNSIPVTLPPAGSPIFNFGDQRTATVPVPTLSPALYALLCALMLLIGGHASGRVRRDNNHQI